MRPGTDQADIEATDRDIGPAFNPNGGKEQPRRQSRQPGRTSRPAFSFVLLTLAVIIAGAGAITWALVRPDQRSVEIIIPTPGPVVVHVTGGVENPGVYTLQPDSRVSDAITAAGGLSEPSSINLAASVRDGQQIFVAGLSSQTSGSDGPAAAPSDPNILLDLNTASAVQLEELPNIGPTRAASIIGFRERNGPILFADDLTVIDGIGPVTVDSLRALVVQP